VAQLLDVDERDFVVTVLAEFRLDPDVTLLMDSLEVCTVFPGNLQQHIDCVLF
jgi:hypothetical protein